MTFTLDTAMQFVIAVLFNGLWEAALLGLVAAIVLRTLPNTNATTRHSVLAVALFASLLLPVVTAGITTLHSPTVPQASTPLTTRVHHHGYATPATTTVRISPGSTIAAPATPTWSRINLTLPRAFAIAIVAIWVVGAAFVLLRLILSLLHLERLKRDALPLPMEYRKHLVRWESAAKGSRTVRLCRSDEIVIPLAVGLFDAMILVPERLIEELGHADIDQIVLHELAHLRRSDDWVNAIERVAQALLFFNPGILWIIAQLDLEREVACDDWVLQQNDALPYATCLAKVVETTIWPYRAMSAPGAFVTRRGMSVRIERLLSAHRDVRVRTSFGTAGIAVVTLGALCIAAAFVSPSIAYTGVPDVALPHVVIPPVAMPHVNPVPNPRVDVALVVKQAVTAKQVFHQTVATTANEATAAPSVVAANTPDYIDEMASVGYTHLSIDELVQLRSVGVTADYVRQLQSDGISHPSVEELVSLRAQDIDPAYIRAMRDHFGSSLSPERLAGLKAVGVTPAYINELTTLGVPNTDADQVQSMRAVGVTAEYARGLSQAGYSHLTGEQLLQMRSLGIDAAFISRAAAHGFTHLSVDKLTQLKASGILQ